MSYGALVTIDVAGAHRTELRGLVIIDTGPDLNEDAAKEIVEFTRGDYEMDSVDDFVDRAMMIRPSRRKDFVGAMFFTIFGNCPMDGGLGNGIGEDFELRPSTNEG